MRKVYSELTQTELVLPEKCNRVISFSPAITETIYELGLESILIGVSSYCVHPEKAKEKPKVGSYNNFKENLIDELQPELILTTTGYQIELLQKLKNKYPVFPIRLPITVSDILSFCTEVGIILGYYENARNLEKKLFLSLLDLLNNLRNDSSYIPKIYVEIDLGGPVTFGAYSYITDAIDLLGGENIFSDEHKEWLTPNYETVIERNPDIIIYEPRMFSKRKTIDEIFSLFNQKLPHTNAIKNNQIFITPGNYDFLAHHGPSFITHALPWLKEIITKFKQTN